MQNLCFTTRKSKFLRFEGGDFGNKSSDKTESDIELAILINVGMIWESLLEPESMKFGGSGLQMTDSGLFLELCGPGRRGGVGEGSSHKGGVRG